jgi:2-dehydro-3-deoxyphosphogluconate aldolase / (4S)-4-hydroxy-2-oxoglutarate aldolase
MVALEDPVPNGLVGIVRADDSDVAFKAAVAAVEGGLQTVQVSAPDAIDIARGVSASTGGRAGVGSITDARSVALARKARIPFVATSFLQPDVAAAARREGMVCVIGATTPSEVFEALRAGATVVDIFPIGSMGGPDYVRWLREPLPNVPLRVSGGVEHERIPEYLQLGVTIGLSTSVFPAEALRRGDFAAIRELAARAAATVPQAVWR